MIISVYFSCVKGQAWEYDKARIFHNAQDALGLASPRIHTFVNKIYVSTYIVGQNDQL
jgi:hypothetical protein